MHGWRECVLGFSVAVGLTAGAGTPAAVAADTVPPPPSLFVTVAARECPTYDSITANLARNNIQESLRDLGANAAYSAGTAINPVTEAAKQPACKPITGWSFTLGKGIIGRAVSGSGARCRSSPPRSRTSTPRADSSPCWGSTRSPSRRRRSSRAR